MCEFPDKYIKYPNWSYVLNCCSEFPGVFDPDASMNGENICTFHLFFLIIMKMLDLVI